MPQHGQDWIAKGSLSKGERSRGRRATAEERRIAADLSCRQGLDGSNEGGGPPQR